MLSQVMRKGKFFAFARSTHTETLKKEPSFLPYACDVIPPATVAAQEVSKAVSMRRIEPGCLFFTYGRVSLLPLRWYHHREEGEEEFQVGLSSSRGGGA